MLANLKQQRNLEKNNKEIVISSNIRLGGQSYDSSKNGVFNLSHNDKACWFSA
jgi:hypothetical protein